MVTEELDFKDAIEFERAERALTLLIDELIA